MWVLALVIGLGLGVVGTRRFWPRTVTVVHVVEPELPPPRKRFRVIFDTELGGTARRVFEGLNVRAGERAEIWDGQAKRGARNA